MANEIDLGYIKAPEYGQGLAGLGKIAQDMRTAKTQFEGKKALQEAWKSGDADKLYQVGVDFPDLMDDVKYVQEARRAKQTDTVLNNAIDAMDVMSFNTPGGRRQAMTEKRDMLREKGDPRWADVDSVLSLDDVVQQDAMLKNAIQKAYQMKLLTDNTSGSGSAGNPRALTSLGQWMNVNGKQILKVPYDMGNGAIEMKYLGEDGEFLNNMGETIGQQSDRKTDEARDKVRVKIIEESANQSAENIRSIDNFIINLDEGINLLDKEGAETGIFDSITPSLIASSAEFDNLIQRMGLNVAQDFKGAMSDNDIRIAMATAFPPNLQPKEGAAWLGKRKIASEQFRNILFDTMRKSIELQKTPAEILIMNYSGGNTSAADDLKNFKAGSQ